MKIMNYLLINSHRRTFSGWHYEGLSGLLFLFARLSIVYHECFAIVCQGGIDDTRGMCSTDRIVSRLSVRDQDLAFIWLILLWGSQLRQVIFDDELNVDAVDAEVADTEEYLLFCNVWFLVWLQWWHCNREVVVCSLQLLQSRHGYQLWVLSIFWQRLISIW